MKITDYELEIAEQIEGYMAEKMTEREYSAERVLVAVCARLFHHENGKLHVLGNVFGGDLQETMETVGK